MAFSFDAEKMGSLNHASPIYLWPELSPNEANVLALLLPGSEFRLWEVKLMLFLKEKRQVVASLSEMAVVCVCVSGHGRTVFVGSFGKNGRWSMLQIAHSHRVLCASSGKLCLIKAAHFLWTLNWQERYFLWICSILYVNLPWRQHPLMKHSY